jgi:hypothetical protein
MLGAAVAAVRITDILAGTPGAVRARFGKPIREDKHRNPNAVFTADYRVRGFKLVTAMFSKGRMANITFTFEKALGWEQAFAEVGLSTRGVTKVVRSFPGAGKYGADWTRTAFGLVGGVRTGWTVIHDIGRHGANTSSIAFFAKDSP